MRWKAGGPRLKSANMWQTSSESVILEWSRSDNNLKEQQKHPSVCKYSYDKCHGRSHQRCHKTSNRSTWVNGAAPPKKSSNTEGRVMKNLGDTDCRKSVMFETRVFNKKDGQSSISQSNKTTSRRNINVEKMDKIRALFEQIPARDETLKLTGTYSAVPGNKSVKHQSQICNDTLVKSTAPRTENYSTRQKSNGKLTNGRTQSDVAGTKQNAAPQSSCSNITKNKMTIPRAHSAFGGGRENMTQQSHLGAYQTLSMPRMPQTHPSTILEHASLSTSHGPTVAHSQMKFWHLRKIIRDTLVRYGDIGENECSQELDEAISSYAIHYMLKPNTFKMDLESAGAEINDELVSSDHVQHSEQNKNGRQNRVLHHAQAPVSDKNKSRVSSDKSDVDLSRRIDFLLGRKCTLKGHEGHLIQDNGKSPDNESSEKIQKQDNHLHQGHDTHQQNNVNQLVDKCFLLVTETQNNLTNMGNLIDSIHKIIDTCRKVRDEMRPVNVPRISVTAGDEEYLKKCDTGLPIPLSHSTTAPSSCSLNSGQISPYPRIYPMINLQGDAGDALTMATTDVAGDGHSEVDVNSKVLEDADGIERMSLPKINVSLDHDDMWKQIVEKSRHRPERRITKLEHNHLDSKDVSKAKLYTCFSTNEKKSMENKERSCEMPPRSSLTDTDESDQENVVSSPPSYEGLLSTFYEKEHTSHVFDNTRNRICRREHQPSIPIKLPENTVEKLDNVLSILEKMLHELAEIIDLLVYGDSPIGRIQDEKIQDCASCSSSSDSVISQTSSKATKAVKSSKYDALMERLSQGLQKMFTSKHKLKSPSADLDTRRIHSVDVSEGTQGLIDNNFDSKDVFVV